MSILAVDCITKYFGSNLIIHDACFHIEEKDRVGLVGANGAGKTTLFGLLVGKIDPDDGRVVRSSGLTIGTMEQHVPEDSVQSAWEWVLSAFSDLLALEKQMNQVQEQIEQGDTKDELLLQQQHLREAYEQTGGLWFRSRARSALAGLGFTEEQINLPLSSLSGGQRSKLGLARLLVSRAKLLLLDEPTNHLDIVAIRWLEEFLRSYDGAFIVISHDRYFLDRVTQKTMELEYGRLTVYNGDYSRYLSLKKENRQIAQHHYEQQLKEIHRLEDAVTEMKRWNREKSIKRAESKEKVIDKLRDQLVKPENESETIRFAFSVRQPGPGDVLTVENLSFGYSKPLYSQVGFGIKKGERVFLIGPNGCGKTTLLKQLLHQIHGQGSMVYGPGVDVGYYDQTGQQLHPTKTVLDEVWDDYSHLDQTTIRNGLASFLFKGEDVFKQVGTCSGGEKARIALLKIMLKGSNFLLLDEPTNHLDIGSREALEDALTQYDGTLLMVSHDRYFINKLANRILLLTSHGVEVFEGNYDDYLSLMEQERSLPQKKTTIGNGGKDYKEKKQKESQLRKLRTLILKTEETITQLELKGKDIKQQIASPEIAADYVKVMELTETLADLEQQIEEQTLLWTESQEQLEQMEIE